MPLDASRKRQPAEHRPHRPHLCRTSRAVYSLVVRPRTGFPGWLEFAVTSANGTEPGEPSYAVHRTVSGREGVVGPKVSKARLTTRCSLDRQNGGHDLYDPLTEVRLGTSAVAPPSLPNAKPNPKHRLTRLFDPDVDVHLWNHGGLSWSWKMEWEEVSYVWTREVASLLSSERSYTLSVASLAARILRTGHAGPC